MICCGPQCIFMPLGNGSNTVCCTICANQVSVGMHHTDRCSQECLLGCQALHILWFPGGQIARQQALRLSFILHHVQEFMNEQHTTCLPRVPQHDLFLIFLHPRVHHRFFFTDFFGFRDRKLLDQINRWCNKGTIRHFFSPKSRFTVMLTLC